MTLCDRSDAYRAAFAKWPASWVNAVREQERVVLYGIWLIGNDYRNKAAFYGAYPPGYLARVMALFPDAGAPADGAELPLFAKLRPRRRKTPAARVPSVLHVFSGSLPASPAYLRCDSHQPAELACSVYDLPTVVARARQFRLVLADPPYSAADAERYGTPGVDRRRALAALAAVTAPGGHLCWLDTVWPMHSKRQWVTVGRICVQRSTNHRVRLLSIFERISA